MERAGPKGIHGWLASLGFRFVALMTLLLILAEDGGLLFAIGLVTPLAALMIVASLSAAFILTALRRTPAGNEAAEA